MRVHRLWLTDVRSYASADVEFGEGLTVIVGPNGTGKTNLLEAVGYLATLGSFRGAPTEAMVRQGASEAVLRAETSHESRQVLIEAEIAGSSRRGRVLVNKQALRRTRDLLGVLRVSVFSPDDLALVKGGPSERRQCLDQALVGLHPRNDALVTELDRILRQRNALLRQCGGRLAGDAAITLDVWDAKLAATGTALSDARCALVGELGPILATAYRDIAGASLKSPLVRAAYVSSWRDHPGGLEAALQEGRVDDVRRGLSLIGPHRDDLTLTIDGRSTRTHASQGEQRTVALALRLGVHRLLTAALGSAPVLLLDDVFSELDPMRSEALLAHLPPGQTLLATAGVVPPSAHVERTIRVAEGIDGTLLHPSAGDKLGETVDETALESAK